MPNLKDLKLLAKDFSILYIEDDTKLRKSLCKFLLEYTNKVYTAKDGKEGLDVFKKKHPQIVITDIKIPFINGMKLAKYIRILSPNTKVIILSELDDQDYIKNSINLGIFKFLKKPIDTSKLLNTIYKAILQIKHQDYNILFYTHLQNIFNYQSSMIIMYQGSLPIIANKPFLKFFNIKSVKELVDKHYDLGSRFLAHNGFLYNTENIYWFDEVEQCEHRLFHVKLLNEQEDVKHFILKCTKIPNNAEYIILSFDDVTDLNLLKVYDPKRFKDDINLKDTHTIFNIFEVIKRNHTKVELHNYYKGLSITNNGLLSKIQNNNITLTTNYIQQKAIQYEKKTLITSNVFPHPIICNTVVNISFEKQSIELTDIYFKKSSPVTRRTVRLVPEENHGVSLFVKKTKVKGNMRIEDISLDAIKLELNSIPEGLVEDEQVLIEIILNINNTTVVINTEAVMLRKSENQANFSIVFILKLAVGKKNTLVDYITNRQMSIIREFKGLQNG